MLKAVHGSMTPGTTPANVFPGAASRYADGLAVWIWLDCGLRSASNVVATLIDTMVAVRQSAQSDVKTYAEQIRSTFRPSAVLLRYR